MDLSNLRSFTIGDRIWFDATEACTALGYGYSNPGATMQTLDGPDAKLLVSKGEGILNPWPFASARRLLISELGISELLLRSKTRDNKNLKTKKGAKRYPYKPHSHGSYHDLDMFDCLHHPYANCFGRDGACRDGHTGYEEWHGTLSGYTSHRCSCLDCRQAIQKYYISPVGRHSRQEQNLRRQNARRARKRGAPHQDYTRLEIATRDRWRCGICSERIDASLQWPNPDSLSIDHITPLAKGGHDVASNVQASHLHCNIQKKDRISQ